MHCVVTGLTAALLSAAVIAGNAWAQRATTELEMKAGPGKPFPLVARIPRGEAFQVHGCVENYTWCDVSRQDDRGWATADQIEIRFRDRDVRVSEYGPRLQIPVVGFAFSAYWDAYYTGRPWYQERDRWKIMWRDQPEYLRYGRAERPTSPGGILDKRDQSENSGAAAEEGARSALERNAETDVGQDDANSSRDGRDGDSRPNDETGSQKGAAAGINSQPGITGPTGNATGQPETPGGPTSDPSVRGPTPGNPTTGGTAGSTSGPASGSGSRSGAGGSGSGSGAGSGGGGGGGGGS